MNTPLSEAGLLQRLPLMGDYDIIKEREKIVKSITLDSSSMALRRMALACSKELARRRLAAELLLSPRR